MRCDHTPFACILVALSLQVPETLIVAVSSSTREHAYVPVRRWAVVLVLACSI